VLAEQLGPTSHTGAAHAGLMLGAAQAECEASMMHGAELADARAAVWQSAAGRLLEVRDAADGLASAHVRRLCSLRAMFMCATQG